MHIKLKEFVPGMYPYQNKINKQVVNARMINAPFSLETETGMQYGTSGDYVVEKDGNYTVAYKEKFEPSHTHVFYGE